MDFLEHKKEIEDRCDLLVAHCKSLLNFNNNPVEGLEEIVRSVDSTKELADKLSEVAKGLNGAFTHDTSVAIGISAILTEIEYDVTKIGLAYDNIIAHMEKESNNVVRRNESLGLNNNTVLNKLLFERIRSNNVLVGYANDKLKTSYKQLNPELESCVNPEHTLYNLPKACLDTCKEILEEQKMVMSRVEQNNNIISSLDIKDSSEFDSNIYSTLDSNCLVQKHKEQCVRPSDCYQYVNAKVNECPTTPNIDFISVVEYVDDTYANIYNEVTETIKSFKSDCIKLEEYIKTFTASVHEVLEISKNLTSGPVTSDQYIETIDKWICKIKVFTAYILDAINVTLNHGYMLEYLSNTTHNLYLTTINTFNMVE